MLFILLFRLALPAGYFAEKVREHFALGIGDKFEGEARAGLPAQETIRLPDGTTRNIFNVGEEVGIYTAIVNFVEAGDWGVEIKVEADKPTKISKTLRPRFNVLLKGSTVAIGSPAPKSKNLTADDVQNIAQIDSSSKPSREMHTSTIAAAIAAGKPTLVLFAVPGFCESRLCGPEIEIMRNQKKIIPIDEGADDGRAESDPVQSGN